MTTLNPANGLSAEAPSDTQRRRHTCAHLRALDTTAAERLDALARGSGTAAAAIRLLCGRTRLWLTVAARPALLQHARVRGLSHFWVDNGVLVGRLQFDTGSSSRRQQERAVAHEIAHALELALLPAASRTEELAGHMLSRLGRHLPWWRHARIETPFAIALERTIMKELEPGRPVQPDALRRLARDHAVVIDDRSVDDK